MLTLKHKIPVRIHAAISTAVMLGLSVGTLRAQTNLVANGSFEEGPAGEGQFTGWDWLGPADNNSNYGVAPSGAFPDVAERGSYYAYFRGHPTDNSQDCLGTTVHLKVGGLYSISYYLGADGPTVDSGAGMWVVIGASFGINLAQDVMLTAFLPNSSNAIPYQKFNTFYLATNASPILSFHGINATNGINAASAILLDNISVVLAYPPLSLGFSRPNSLVFTWPFTESPYRLQAVASLSNTDWMTLTNVPVDVGTNSQIVLPVSANLQFFRLTLP
jgi:hypothetical protein